VQVWDAETGAAVGEPLRGHDGWLLSVAVTADGTRIVSGCEDATGRVWDAEQCLPRPRPAPYRHIRQTQSATRPQ
jgi:WD40 repeat protein